MTPDELRARFASLAVLVEGLTDPLLDKIRSRESALQARRAASSAAAMHRAAGRARSHREFTSTLAEALEEADETCFWLEHLLACEHLSGAPAAAALDEAKQLVAILTTSHSTSQRRDQHTSLPPRHRSPRRHRRRAD